MPRFRLAPLAALLLVLGCSPGETNKPRTLDDVSRLNATPIRELVRVTEEAQVIEALKRARQEHLHVSIAGRRHSQGGQAFGDDAIVLDMTGFKNVLAVDPTRKTIRVQSGISWHDVQDAADPHGLAVKVMQSSNIFTVGGSISVNAHGRDPRFGSLIETVLSFRLAGPDGAIVNVSRTENPELFALVNGGYGLFGVILDVELSLTDNVPLRKTTELLDFRDYPRWFDEHVRARRAVGLHYARLSNAPASFLREMYATSFLRGNPPEIDRARILRLVDDEPVAIPKFFLGLARHTDWGKSLDWYLQKKVVDPPGEGDWISRNNAMRPAVAFLDYDSAEDTDILQEYFVPPDRFIQFVDGMRDLFLREKVDLLNVTVRFVPKNDEAALSYSRQETFALVLYINQGRSKEGIDHARRWTRELVEIALAAGGTYYLPYQGYPTREQMRRAYPETDRFFQLKRQHDPSERFSSRFYSQYGKEPETPTQ